MEGCPESGIGYGNTSERAEFCSQEDRSGCKCAIHVQSKAPMIAKCTRSGFRFIALNWVSEEGAYP
jgi:hypothetical protein